MPQLVAAAALTLLSVEAHSQSMDYGALEQVFGEPVTTSATGTPQRVTDVPTNMEIVTAEDIRRSGANSIPDVLRHVAGIDVLQWTSDEADVGVRGYDQVRSPRLLVLIDGRQVYADFYGFTPWSTLPVELSAIRQIVVVKGPNSALLGFNAVGGVINIVTYSPLYDDVNTASATGGTQNLIQGSAVGTFKLGADAGFRVSAGRRTNDDFSTPIPRASAGSPRLGENRSALHLDGQVRVTDNIQFAFEVSRTLAQQVEMDPLYTFSYERYVADSVKVQIAADTPQGLLQLTAYSNWIKQGDSSQPVTDITQFGDRVTVVQFQDIFKPGTDHVLRGTVEYRNDSANTVPIEGARVFYHVLSAGGMWDWSVTPLVSLTNALRIDHLTLGRAGFIPADFPFTLVRIGTGV